MISKKEKKNAFREIKAELLKSESGREILKQLDEEFMDFESVIAIDKDSLKIAKLNGSLRKTVQSLRQKFLIPDLIETEDTYKLHVLIGTDGVLWWVEEKDIIPFLKDQNIKNSPNEVYKIHFGTEERRRWFDSISTEKQAEFQKSIFQALRDLNLSYALYSWLEEFVLYLEENEINEFTYHCSIWDGFDLMRAVTDGYPLGTKVKQVIKKAAKSLKTVTLQNKKARRIFPKKFVNDLKTLPPCKTRRKRMLDMAIDAINQHGQIEEQFDYANLKKERIRITDKILAERLYEKEVGSGGAQKIKKLRQRYKSKLKK